VAYKIEDLETQSTTNLIIVQSLKSNFVVTIISERFTKKTLDFGR